MRQIHEIKHAEPASNKTIIRENKTKQRPFNCDIKFRNKHSNLLIDMLPWGTYLLTCCHGVLVGTTLDSSAIHGTTVNG